MAELVAQLCHSPRPVNTNCYSGASEVDEAVKEGLLLINCVLPNGITSLGIRLGPRDTAEPESTNAEILLDGTVTVDFVALKCQLRLTDQCRSGEARFFTA